MLIQNFRRNRQVVDELAFGWPFVTEARNPHAIYLRNNENPYGGDFRHYPEDQFGKESLPEAYLKLIGSFERMSGGAEHGLSAPNILLTQGAAGALEQVFKAYFEPGIDEVILTSPSFGIFSRVARIYRIATHKIPLSGDGFDRLDIEAICKSKAKGIVLCDPNNPVGSRLHPEDVTRLLENFNGVVIVDEAYVEYSRRCSNLKHLKTFPHLVILRTMSKALGMAGLRIGAAIGSADMIEPLRRVQLPFAISSIAADWCQSAIGRSDEIHAGIEQFRVERDRVHRELRRLPYLSGIWGEDGGFLTIRTSCMNDVARVLLAKQIEPVFNPEGLQDYVRISIGTPYENDCLIQALQMLT
jgi:histidinol-phosphate aminotransferase